jgi:hypothetical protein
LDRKNLKEILAELFKYMDQEDKKDIVERYGEWHTFKEIQMSDRELDTQLELFL